MESNQTMTSAEIIHKLTKLGSKKDAAGMARFGIRGKQVLGVSMTETRALGKHLGKDHALAKELWTSEIHEARILASIVDDYKQVTPAQMEEWVKQIDSWDLCDQVMSNLFCRTPYALDKIKEWAHRTPEFERRSAFSLIAYVAVHRKKDISDEQILELFPLIRQAASDERNFVKKAVNWALRQSGKRSSTLLSHALKLAQELAQSDNKTEKWIGQDAAKELEIVARKQFTK